MAVVAETQPVVDDLASQVQDGGAVVQHEAGVGGEAKQLDPSGLLPNAELAGTVQLWEWIGDEGATTFSY